MNIQHQVLFLLLMMVGALSHAQVSENMTLLDTWHPGDLPSASGVIYNDLWGYSDQNGREYAILGSAQFVHFIDVTDPSNVVEVDRVKPGQSTVWRDFKTFGNRAYAVSDNTGEGLIILDLSSLPDSVTVTYQSTEFFTQCHNIFIDEDHGRLYVAGANTRSNGILVLDLNENADSPTLLSSQALSGGYVHDLFVKDNIVYGSHGFSGLYVWDYNDLNNIELLASTPTNGYNHSSWLSDDCRYVIYAEEIPAGVDLGVLDVQNLLQGEMELAHTFKFPLLAPDQTSVTPHNPYIRDTMLVVSYYEDGTQVFTFGDPLNPQPYAHYDTHNNDSYRGTSGNWGTYPFLPSGNIISSDIRNGLFVMRISDYDPSTFTRDFEINLSETVNIEACDYEEVSLSAIGSFQNYFWYKDGEKMEATGSTINISESGTYVAKAINGQCEFTSGPITYTIHQTTIPSIAVLGSELEAMPNEGIYTWHMGNETIENVTSNRFEPEFNGVYWVDHQDQNGCSVRSDSVFYFIPKAYNNPELEGFDVRYSNQYKELIINLLTISNQSLNFNLYNVMGQAMYRDTKNVAGFANLEIDTGFLNPGVYFLVVDNGSVQDAVKIFIN